MTGDLDERVLESRRQLEADLRARLTDGLASAGRAMAQARARRADGGAATARAAARLDDVRRELERIGAEAEQEAG
ncbi:MAG: hypothetical protein KGN76_08625 [Acidobacteriota bacterium]|nr:hypothetical protein [Acidobacteriota bacterium]